MASAVSVSSYLTSSATAKRPDPTQLADDIFSKLDTKNQGYIDKSDLQSALDSLSAGGSTSTTASSSNASSADALFSQLDANGDGKVTQSEMESGMQKLANALDSQAMGSRMHHGGHHHHGGVVAASTSADQTQTDGTPPPTQNAGGLTQDQLTSIATKLSADPSSANSQRAQLVNDVANNFSKADANGDGKVSFREAIAYEKSTKAASASAGTSSDSSSGNNSASTQETQARMMHQLMQLIQAYGNGSQDAQAATQSASPVSSILAVA